MDISKLEIENTFVIQEFHRQCGEVFLSINGNLSFLCTLCGMKYESYQAYADHIMEKHHLSNSSKENEYSNIDNETQTDFLYDETEAIIAAELDVSVHQLKNYIESSVPEPDNFVEIDIHSTVATNMEDASSSQCVYSTVESLKKTTEPKSTKMRTTRTRNKLTQKTHKFSCPKCDFVTKTYSTLMMHVERHKGKKKHICKECEKGFFTSSELQIHTRSHTGERPYVCADCGQAFVAYSTLWRHNKSCKNIRDQACILCEKKFSTTTALRNHMAVHSEQRSFKCSECDASFKLQKILRNHMKIHENMREFKCSYCPASFNQQPGLLSHVKSKHS